MPWPSINAIMSSFTVVRSSGMGDIFERSAKPALYAVRNFGARGRSMRCGASHQAHEHAIELFRVEVKLNFNGLGRGMNLLASGPGERISVSCAAIQVDSHIAGFGSGDDAGIDPRGSSNFVPHDVGAGCEHGKSDQVACQRRSTGFNLLEERSSKMSFHGNICRRTDHSLPGRTQDNRSRLRIKPEIEFVSRIAEKLRIVRFRTDAPTHEDQLLG